MYDVKENSEINEMEYQAPPSPPAQVRPASKKSSPSIPDKLMIGSAMAAAAKKKKGKKGEPAVKKVFEGSITKEMVIEYLVSEGYASNEVSAEIIHTHISNEFLEGIEAKISVMAE